ncbi:MAG TPA: spermidine synthase, partial [Actinomycetota bacterium]|nr:spermidine synthase [Actinomycetota bacterium]
MLLSFLMLFVELALIRWAGSNVVYLSFFSNFVLLGSFLGIGIGFLRARARRNAFPWAPVGLAFLVIFVRGFPVEIDRGGTELIFFGAVPSGLPPWATLPLIFVAVAATMAMIAEGVARTFVRFPPLEAYRLDLAGSILGIVAFSGLSFLRAPPVVWGIVSGLVFAVLLRRGLRLVDVAAILAVIGLLAAESMEATQSWSPYYRVTVSEVEGRSFDAWNVDVNGIPHQWIGPIEARRRIEPVYFLPYERWRGGAPRDVLIVGAGTGTDVAIALSEGARHVDAVEIDPRIYEIG